VGLGLLAALRLSGTPELRAEVKEILERHDLLVEFTADWGAEDVIEVLQGDKKRTSAGVGFVLLSEPGQPRPGQLVPPDDLRAAVEELYE
jgi:3-dehydroquinate synthetase